MKKTNFWSLMTLFLCAICATTLTACGDDDDDNGGGGGSDNRINSVFTSKNLNTMSRFMPIHRGTTPPTLEGTYKVSPDIKIVEAWDDYVDEDKVQMHSAYYFRFYDFDAENRTVRVASGEILSEVASKTGAVSYISGSGNNFTVCRNLNTWNYAISGTLTSSGISNFFIACEVTDEDYGDGWEVGDLWISKDGDGMAEKVE